eukprot:scaffold2197_cov76-Skeletonema_dohrnii-CCMP3373.AAC.1
MVSKSRWGSLAAAGGAHYFSRGKVYTSSASKQPCRWLNSAGRPLPYRASTVFTRAHCRRTSSCLTSSFVKQAPPLTTAADD